MVLILGAGCAAQGAQAPLDPPVQTPERWAHGSEGTPATGPWWASFADAHLEALIGDALQASLDLRGARARVRQARTAARQAGSARWPQVAAGLSAARSKGSVPKGVPAASAGSFDDPTDRFGATLSASYDPDLWGRNEATTEAAEAEVMAAEEGMRAAGEVLARGIAEAWFSLAEVHARRTMLDEQLDTSRTYLDLVTRRFEAGLASLLAVRQQRQQLIGLEARQPLVRSEIDATAMQLAVLVGRPPDPALVPTPEGLPNLPPPPALGVPADLLHRRPDLRAARRRLEAQDRRVAAAFADRFPALRLSASAGLQAEDLSTLVDRFLWSVASDLTMPLLDGGRRAAEEARRRAQLEEQLAAYGKALLKAWLEVESALRAEAGLRAHIADGERQLDAAQAVLDEAKARYQRGVGDFLPVLDALRRRQDTELSLLSARKRLLIRRVHLYAALGGDWTQELASP